MTFSIAEVFLMCCVFGLVVALLLSMNRNAMRCKIILAMLESIADKRVVVRRNAEGIPQVYPINQGE